MKNSYLIAIFLTLTACSPYAEPLRQLSAAHASGRISDSEFYHYRCQLMAQDQQWHADLNRQINALNGAVQQVNQSMQEQQEINAYNQRTLIMSQPQQVNVHVTPY